MHPPQIATLVLLRHGESALTADGRFAGWTDVTLSSQGWTEASTAAELLLEAGLDIEVAFTSALQRTIATARLIGCEFNKQGRPSWTEYRRWELNERCYGALEGKNKKECSAEFGAAKVRQWRRAFDTRPPPLTTTDPRWPGHSPLFASLPDLPVGESPADVLARVQRLWTAEIVPLLKTNTTVLIVAHGTPLRCIMKLLEGLSVAEIEQTEIPSGCPLVYRLDTTKENLQVLEKQSLVDPAEVRRRQELVRLQSELHPQVTTTTTATAKDHPTSGLTSPAFPIKGPAESKSPPVPATRIRSALQA
eukprot:Protomagalhaensia_wolfi_Nauph_80__2295@NODE_24_length_4807_cov_26_465604_g19_i0_p2_GENE_NODE_24_length_4807_cov_26_465604_g19_i0NODE_24_length_4807_cov_26_465604_g19_i0_p2_ORF_typecomplete_len306_score42_04His_Phos_1/PF00300_22/8_8e38_NODE_24_length_4807_cov_26_465604_g19_i035264443